MSPGVQARFLSVIDLIELGGLEGLPPSIADRDGDKAWRVRIVAPDGAYAMRIISEAHGKRRPINYDDGQVMMPTEMKSGLLQRDEVHEACVREAPWYQRAALTAIAGMEEDDLVIPPPRPR
jgi:hypothetical protein